MIEQLLDKLNHPVVYFSVLNTIITFVLVIKKMCDKKNNLLKLFILMLIFNTILNVFYIEYFGEHKVFCIS
jgi:hypothetical protein